MPLLAAVVQVVVLFGSTLLIIVADRAYRKSHPPDGVPLAEPGFGQLLLLTVLCNIAALPAYFYQTRGKGLWLLVGFAAFLLCFGASFVASVLVSIVGAVAG